MERIKVMVIIRAMETGNNSKSIQYEKNAANNRGSKKQ